MDVLVLSSHTDDSELSAGGTINRLRREGHDVYYVVFSTCDGSLPSDQQGLLKREFERVMEFVEPVDYFVMDYDVRRFSERRQDILDDLVTARNDLDPDLVIGPSRSDCHQDHQVVAREMFRAFKRDASILAYEQPWNSVSFDTNLLSPITETDLDAKLTQLAMYESQLELGRPYFDEEFVRGLARVRGVQGATQYAEAFEVVRWSL